MIKEKKNITQENEAAFAVCMALINFLILAVVGAVILLMFLVINETSSIDAILHGRFLP